MDMNALREGSLLSGAAKNKPGATVGVKACPLGGDLRATHVLKTSAPKTGEALCAKIKKNAGRLNQHRNGSFGENGAPDTPTILEPHDVFHNGGICDQLDVATTRAEGG